jgi:small subunit ribosomal protein S7
MPRKKRKLKRREVGPDLKYNSVIVQKLINRVMKDGKKTVAMKIVYGALDYLAEKTKEPALVAFEKALNNIKPPVEVRSRRVGGATYQVPVDVRPERQISLAIRWLVTLSQEKKGKPMVEKLGSELVDAYNNVGSCVKKKIDTVKMAEANKAFAHYKW